MIPIPLSKAIEILLEKYRMPGVSEQAQSVVYKDLWNLKENIERAKHALDKQVAQYEAESGKWAQEPIQFYINSLKELQNLI